jgi:hypothetical protein
MQTQNETGLTPHVQAIVSPRYPFFCKGDEVVIHCNDEGYSGQRGKIVAVFASGRCHVAVGPIAILNLPPGGMQHVERERTAVVETNTAMVDVR